jgi:hypothetical protein
MSEDISSQSAPSAHTMNLAELQGAYAVLAYKHQNLQQRQKRNSNGRNNGGKRQKADKTVTAEPVTAASCKFYCHAHGYQNSHQSAQCKVMSSQRGNFTPEMRKAPDPQHPAGGSTLVRGQSSNPPPTQTTAYMLVSVDHIDPLEHASSTENSPERNLTDDLVESNHSVSPPPSPNDAMQSSSVPEDITYDHQAAHIAAILGKVRNSPSPTARMSFFDEEYVQGRRVPSPPPTSIELDFEPESAVNHVRNNIVRLLAQGLGFRILKNTESQACNATPRSIRSLAPCSTTDRKSTRS